MGVCNKADCLSSGREPTSGPRESVQIGTERACIPNDTSARLSESRRPAPEKVSQAMDGLVAGGTLSVSRYRRVAAGPVRLTAQWRSLATAGQAPLSATPDTDSPLRLSCGS